MPAEHDEDRRALAEPVWPLSTLARALRSGNALTVAPGGAFVLLGTDGEELARGTRLDELALILAVAEGRPPRRPRLPLQVSAGLLAKVAAVRYCGESLGDFARAAIQAEAERREAEINSEMGPV